VELDYSVTDLCPDPVDSRTNEEKHVAS
jgi:hypothetical protein